jgi:hypothetical protein
MSDLIFFIKLFCLTVALVLVMQIQVGERSLESHAMGWVQTSALVAPLNTVAQGAAKAARDLSSTIHASIEKNTGKKKKEAAPKASSFRWFHHQKADPEQSSSESN